MEKKKKKLIYLHNAFFLVEIANRYYGVYNTHTECTPIICTRFSLYLLIKL